ncbi:hypothetical protein BU15DRAFT_68793 [Melanogaster broomeanus]|nr:hypothetical protein BU15DRAFT_68793 [Melanogaster broomeanus]
MANFVLVYAVTVVFEDFLSITSMVWLTGGYILDPADAKTWAQRRHPEIQFDHDWLIPNRIDRYFQTHEPDIWCIGVEYKGQDMAYFVTCGINHTTTVQHRPRRFREDRFGAAWKEKLFGGWRRSYRSSRMLYVKSGNVLLTPIHMAIGRAKRLDDVHNTHTGVVARICVANDRLHWGPLFSELLMDPEAEG